MQILTTFSRICQTPKNGKVQVWRLSNLIKLVRFSFFIFLTKVVTLASYYNFKKASALQGGGGSPSKISMSNLCKESYDRCTFHLWKRNSRNEAFLTLYFKVEFGVVF